MSASPLERARLAIEEFERIEQGAVEVNLNEHQTFKKRYEQEARTAFLLNEMLERLERVEEWHRDETGEKAAELEAIRGVPAGQPFEPAVHMGGALQAFYGQLAQLEQAARDDPDSRRETAVTFPRLETFPLPPEYRWAPAERSGRYLDLHFHYNEFLKTGFFARNCAGRPLPYTEYLQTFADFSRVTERDHASRAWCEYLRGLGDYLEAFARRRTPLETVDLSDALRSAPVRLRNLLAARVQATENALATDGNGPFLCGVCVVTVDSAEAFRAHLGGRRHRAACRRCGVEPDAFVLPDDVPRPPRYAQIEASYVAAARVEALAELLAPVVDATLTHVEQRMARTSEEHVLDLQEDSDAEEQALADAERLDARAEVDEERRIWNPKNLPLDFDGKPIPFWLYRINGLSVKHRCEICGDRVYHGLLNFERHFNEACHASAMRALGIPNTREFFGITRIEDARRLHRRLSARARSQAFDPELDIEVEDDEGRVLTRKRALELLARRE